FEVVGITLCTIAAITGWSLILKSLNRREDADDPGDKSERQPYPLRHIRGLSLMLTVVLLALCFTGYLALQKNLPVYKADINSMPISEFLDETNAVYNVDVDFSRPYDPDGENVWYIWSEGIMTCLEQKVNVGDEGYLLYEYRYDEDSGEYGEYSEYYLLDFSYYTYADDEDEESEDVYHPWRLVYSKERQEQDFYPDRLSGLPELEFGKDYIFFFCDISSLYVSDENPITRENIRYIDDGKLYYYEDNGSENDILSSAYRIVFVSVTSAIVLAEAVLFICLSVKIRKKRQTE
ncbi:MAG: hypothetical protein MJ072_06680, partial [Clostridia bacterium]|nr:hypothetical protein [Clostridia bacterium]